MTQAEVIDVVRAALFMRCDVTIVRGRNKSGQPAHWDVELTEQEGS